VVDARRRLIVTNDHVLEGIDSVRVAFPAVKDGRVVNDAEFYFEGGKLITSTVIDSSRQRDLALVQLDALPDGVPDLPLAGNLPEPGERVFTIAALARGEDNFWNFTSGSVRLVNRRHLANFSIANVVETDLPFNHGNSGGPVVNDCGELVAVVEGAEPEARLVSLSVALDEVRHFLADCDRLVEPQTAADYHRRGQRPEAAGRYDLAIYDYTAALRMDPSLARAKVGRGHAFFRKGDIRTTLAELDDAVRSNPELAPAHLGRGVCHLGLRQYEQALADFTEAIRRDPENADAYGYRAQVYRKTGNLGQSLSDYNRSLALDPRNVASVSERGQLYRVLRRYDEALADFERCH
jgi:tetratricopeptide (TPR) repeat protein